MMVSRLNRIHTNSFNNKRIAIERHAFKKVDLITYGSFQQQHAELFHHLLCRNHFSVSLSLCFYFLLDLDIPLDDTLDEDTEQSKKGILLQSKHLSAMASIG